MKLAKPFSRLIILIYLVTTVLWILFVWETRYTGTLEGWKFDYLLKPFLMGMTILPITGGILGIKNSMSWGGLKSAMGRATLFISLGLLAWGGGMVIWNYYLFFTNIEVPYPSLADVIFILSWPLWSYGLIELSKAIGAQFGWHNMLNKKRIFFVSAIFIIASFYLLFGVARQWSVALADGGLKLFFDLFYPIGSIIISTLVALIYWLSRNLIGGVYKKPVMILLFGFMINYIGDFTFSYTTTKGTYFNGHIADFIFTTAMFAISLGLSLLHSHPVDYPSNKQS